MAKRRKKAKRRKNPAMLVVRNPSRRKRSARKRAPVKRTRKKSTSKRSSERFSIPPELRKARVTIADLKALAKRDREFAKALKRYRKFHGSWPDSIEPMELPGVKNPGFRYVVGLGDTRAHEYEVPDSSGRRGMPFRHAFKRGRQLTATDPDGKALHVVKRRGSRLRVTDRGIRDD